MINQRPMNSLSFILVLCIAVAGVWGAVREKRQQRTVIERTVINNYGGQGFNRQPGFGNGFGGFNNGGGGGWGRQGPGWGNNQWGNGFNRGPFGGPPPPPPPQTIVRTTVIRNG
ncbi:unnamed protein product [Heligmosomoides polygyrus]|uniref:Spicule matrix protein n=1 Tax=Heligmosomoides polygyrus TaxID=6339 RepID=A0A183FL26_HELPZ|nr:unnamed protein product [Heligmosomoides polygyrus]